MQKGQEYVKGMLDRMLIADNLVHQELYMFAHSAQEGIYVALLHLLHDNYYAKSAAIMLKRLLEINYDNLSSSLKQTIWQSTFMQDKYISVVFLEHDQSLLKKINFTEMGLQVLEIYIENVKLKSQNIPNLNQLQCLVKPLVQMLKKQPSGLLLSILSNFLPLLPSSIPQIFQAVISLYKQFQNSLNQKMKQTIYQITQQVNVWRKDLINIEIIQVMIIALKEGYGYQFWDEDDLERTKNIKDYLNLIIPVLISQLVYTKEDLLNLENQSQLEVKYTVRKKAGLLVSKLSCHFGELMFPIAKPYLQKLYIGNASEKQVFCLYLGLIVQACGFYLKNQAALIIQQLFKMLQIKDQVLISTCLWSLKGFFQAFPELLQLCFNSLMPIIFECLISESKLIQKSSMSSFIKFIQLGKNLILKNKDDINKALRMIMNGIRQGNQVGYQGIMEIIDMVEGKGIDRHMIFQQMYPLLIQRFNLNINSPLSTVLHLTIESMTTLQTYFPYYFQLNFNRLFQQYFSTEFSSLKQKYQYKQLILRLYDLIDTFVINKMYRQGIQKVYLIGLQKGDQQIKGFVAAGIGDIAQYYPKLLDPYIENIFAFMISQVQKTNQFNQAMPNNYIIALSHVIIAYPILHQYSLTFSQKIFNIIRKYQLKKSIKINFVKCILRVDQGKNWGKSQAQIVIRGLQSKYQEQSLFASYRNLFRNICSNPSIYSDIFHRLLNSFVNFQNADNLTKSQFHELLLQFKKSIQDWQSYLQSPKFTKGFRQKLLNNYNI